MGSSQPLPQIMLPKGGDIDLTMYETAMVVLTGVSLVVAIVTLGRK
jgi:hypothetical protein